MKPNLSFLRDPRLQTLMGALDSHGYQTLVVGGAARDGLRGETPKDIDLATNARPDDVARVLAQTGAEMKPTGLDHGTWTAMMGGEGFEITTFRRDVSTDGRRATVAFADDFATDAQRRDFTINALGITATGEVVDPTAQGRNDLDKSLLRFVGNGRDRCAEDALRALRLFRFQARMGSWPMLQDSLDAAASADMSKLSTERIWSEVRGMMQAPQGDKAAKAMHQTGLWNALLPHTTFSPERLDNVAERERAAGVAPSWSARLHAYTQRARLPWHLSSAEARRLDTLRKHTQWTGNAAVAAAAAGDTQAGIDLWLLGTTPLPREGVVQAAQNGASAKMTLSSQDLFDRGMKSGKGMGEALKNARDHWLAHDLKPEKDALLAAAGVPAKTKTHTPPTR